MDEDVAAELQTLEQMLEEEKQSLESTLAKEEEARRQLEAEVGQLRAAAADAEEGREEAGGLEDLREELRRMKLRYEGRVWARVDAERDVRRLERALGLVRAKLAEGGAAQATAALLGGKLAGLEQEVDAKLRERRGLEQLKTALEGQLLLLKQQLVRQAAASADVGERLGAGAAVLQKKLQARAGVEEVLLALHVEQALLADRLAHEQRARLQLEVLLDVEVHELNRRLLAESNAREEMRLQVDQALRVRGAVASDLALLKGKLQLLLERQEALAAAAAAAAAPPDAPADAAAYEDPEMADLVALASDVDRQLAVLAELVEPSDLEVLTASGAADKQLERLSRQAAEDAVERKALEERNTALEASLKSLERTLEEERKEAAAHRRAVDEQLASLAALAPPTPAPAP